MKQYTVKPLDEMLSAARLIQLARFAVYEQQPHGNTAIAFCEKQADAERITRLLNEDEMRNEGA